MAILRPMTYMNDAGDSVSPARGALKVELDHVLVIHDEIDLPFGEIRVRTGGGLAGHNGLKSLKARLGSPDFTRVRIGVGRPPTTDPDLVAAYVLGRFREPKEEVRLLIDRAADAAETNRCSGREPPDDGDPRGNEKLIAGCRRPAARRAIAGAAYHDPTTNRITGPKLYAAGAPTKCSPATEDSRPGPQHRIAAGELEVRRARPDPGTGSGARRC